MALRIRDNHAENVRRNELAKARGFHNRYDQRHKIETGVIRALWPQQVTAPKTVKAQNEWQARAHALITGAKPTEYGGHPLPPPEDRCQSWSDMFARASAARFAPDGVKAADAKMYHDRQWPRPLSAKDLGVTRDEYTAAYTRAFLVGPQRYQATRRTGGSYALYYWFVVLNHYMEADEYESRYGPAA